MSRYRPTGIPSPSAPSRPSPPICTGLRSGSRPAASTPWPWSPRACTGSRLYEILEERGFEVVLVNARHVKNVPGRKSDVLDCQWIQELHSVGLLRGSFRPTAEIAALRAYLRHREKLIQGASSHIQRMQKALVQMNLQLHNVISDITGVTGTADSARHRRRQHRPQVLGGASRPPLPGLGAGDHSLPHGPLSC